MNLDHLPLKLRKEVKKRNKESELIQLAEKLLDEGDRINARKVLDLVFERFGSTN